MNSVFFTEAPPRGNKTYGDPVPNWFGIYLVIPIKLFKKT